ncbi:MAG: hypothetical protein HQL67_01410 [Magnetococcales bacterium]|nr:hypothetical protein [Magnetococcales bacterium]
MIINTYSNFAQSYINTRQPSQKFSSTMSNPLLLSTPDALTFELIDSLDSDRSGGLRQSKSGLGNTDFPQTDNNSGSEIGFDERQQQVATERNTYLELLFINDRYSAFSGLSEDGFLQMINPDSDSNILMQDIFKTQERSDFQKLIAFNQSLGYHTRLDPVQSADPLLSEPESEPNNPISELYAILAPLKELDAQTVPA